MAVEVLKRPSAEAASLSAAPSTGVVHHDACLRFFHGECERTSSRKVVALGSAQRGLCILRSRDLTDLQEEYLQNLWLVIFSKLFGSLGVFMR